MNYLGKRDTCYTILSLNLHLHSTYILLIFWHRKSELGENHIEWPLTAILGNSWLDLTREIFSLIVGRNWNDLIKVLLRRGGKLFTVHDSWCRDAKPFFKLDIKTSHYLHMKFLNKRISKWAHLSFYHKRFSRYLHLKFDKEVILFERFSWNFRKYGQNLYFRVFKTAF